MTDTKDRTLLGVLCMIAFALIAPAMDAMAKATPHEVPVAQILVARFGIQVALLVPLSLAMGIFERTSLRDAALHFGRALALLLATWLFFSSLRYMPIANAIAIFFVAPLMVTLLGGLFLGEDVGPRRIIACLVGFVGALFVIQPSFRGLGFVALFPLGTAFCFTLYMLMTRSMSQRIHPVALQAYTAVAATLIVAPSLIVFEGTGNAFFDPVWPQGLAVWTLAGVGLIATVSHLFISFALKFAPAATVAPLQYLEIVGATLIGFFIFDEFPNALTWFGIAIIVGSGLFVLHRERSVGLHKESADVLRNP